MHYNEIFLSIELLHCLLPQFKNAKTEHTDPCAMKLAENVVSIKHVISLLDFVQMGVIQDSTEICAMNVC